MKLISPVKLTVLLLFLLVIPILSQGTIQGVVRDSLTNETLVGANIFVTGTALGAATDVEGDYKVFRVPAGTHVIKVSYVGYKPKVFNVTVENDKTTKLDVVLSPEVLQGNEVVVYGQALGQTAAINQQRASNTIVNVLSEERIQELPDANAAEAIGRLPGVSIQRSGGEANKVVMRGMSDKFSTVTVDGIRMAPTDADSRGLDLSTISQGSLAGIELYKALTPDKDADAIAGSVNLVTKKAPSTRLLRFDAKGAYSKLNKTIKQYDFAGRYGERFFDDFMGVQLSGNLEQRDRSNESTDLNYNTNLGGKANNYEITNFLLSYSNEVRKRGGVSLLLDFNTPDAGNIKISNIYNSTNRDYIVSTRNYPTQGTTDVLYTAQDREQEINTFNSSIHGDNNIFGLSANWGLSFAQSVSEYPYDYYMDFQEPAAIENGVPISRMRAIPTEIMQGPPELLIPYALNNFQKAFLNVAYYRGEKNTDKEKTAFLNLSQKYTFGEMISGDFKFGGKYRIKDREKMNFEYVSPYYTEPYRSKTLENGQIVDKNYANSRFSTLAIDGQRVLSTNFLDPIPVGRNIYDMYNLYPVINRDALRQWWDINKNGVNDDGKSPEYRRNNEADGNYYNITERITSFYLMNTLNWGQDLTFIAGVRVENESNDYFSKYSPSPLTGFPTPSGTIKDTSASHSETIWLPNFHLTFRPTEDVNVRLAAYAAIARPDFNHRLNKFIARNSGTIGGANSVTLYVGNPDLKAAKAMNFEVNASYYSNIFGFISLSGFYKEIKDMYHMVNGVQTTGNRLLDSLNIPWRSPFVSGTLYALTFPYNSADPTKVWGFEIEHQANFRFLPGFLSGFVLNYNLSIVRSETFVMSSHIDSVMITKPGWPFPIPQYYTVIDQKKQKLEGQPELYGNIALGYDIGGLSARLSLFFQGEYVNSFSADGRSDIIQGKFTRLDLALKYEYSDNISLFLNLNNLTNTEEQTFIRNKNLGSDLLNTSEKYNFTSDLGIRITL